MKLDEIFKLWESDIKIDETNLSVEALNIPKLHNKYLVIYTEEKIILAKLEMEFKSLYKKKVEYLLGTLDMDTIKEMGWYPNPKIILKSDIELHTSADPDIQKASLRVSMQKEKVSVLQAILKDITSRQYYIKSSIEYQKLMAGMSW